MPSIIEGYNYDIFISYRQKDNKGDRWVSEFVEALRLELESTFKEEISVYFDINPHDGLLETHDVNASLKEKLKCLVFIPIISRTYCDPKSFAWEHEFKAFVELASKDQFGLKVKLPNGNVVNRVLPVRIHDLDIADGKLCESVLGGALRGIEFIYKETGVNRPLTPYDDERINLNKTRYRNQINKVALAIKETITAIQRNDLDKSPNSKIDKREQSQIPQKIPSRVLLFSVIGIFIILLLVFFDNILYILNIRNKSIRNESIISIETINQTNDSSRLIDPGMISFLIRFNLSNKCNLTLLDKNQFSLIYPTNKKGINLPRKNIEIKIINGGSIQPYDIEYKIIDNQSHSVNRNKITFYTNTALLNFSGGLDKIISDLGGEVSNKKYFTNDWKAFEYYYTGEKAWEVLDKIKAKKSYTNSIQSDASFTLPYLRLAKIYHFEENNKTAKELIDKVKKTIGNLNIPDSLRATALGYTLTGEPEKAIDCYEELISYLPAYKESFYELAEAYFRNVEIQEAINYYRIALTIDPDYSLAHNHLAYCYSARGQHDSALVHVKKYLALDSTTNAWDSYGDILIAGGKLDSARWAKNQGLRRDSLRDYLYQGLAYINIEGLRFKEAEKNINRYISLQEGPLRISRGFTQKAFIYFAIQQFDKSLDTCLKAKSIFDSKDLLTRNHVLHWILANIYLEKNNLDFLDAEMKDMSYIININNINESNYNMIFKFYLDIKIHRYFKEMKIDSAKALIEIFDNDIYDKVKEWNYPFDIAFFNTEFGKLYLATGNFDLAKERFDKALDYNNNYPFAYLGLAGYYSMKNLKSESTDAFRRFFDITKGADPDVYNMILNELNKFKKL